MTVSTYTSSEDPPLGISGDTEYTAGPQQSIRCLVHDLRQPLSAIEMYACLVEMNLPPDDDASRRHLDMLMLELEQISRILSEVSRCAKASERRPPSGL